VRHGGLKFVVTCAKCAGATRKSKKRDLIEASSGGGLTPAANGLLRGGRTLRERRVDGGAVLAQKHPPPPVSLTD
jgi:hypothetical protein